MHALFLIGVAPFVLLFAILALVALVMVASVAVEFPLVLLAVVVFGLINHFLSNPSKKQEVLCGQV